MFPKFDGCLHHNMVSCDAFGDIKRLVFLGLLEKFVGLCISSIFKCLLSLAGIKVKALLDAQPRSPSIRRAINRDVFSS